MLPTREHGALASRPMSSDTGRSKLAPVHNTNDNQIRIPRDRLRTAEFDPITAFGCGSVTKVSCEPQPRASASGCHRGRPGPANRRPQRHPWIEPRRPLRTAASAWECNASAMRGMGRATREGGRSAEPPASRSTPLPCLSCAQAARERACSAAMACERPAHGLLAGESERRAGGTRPSPSTPPRHLGAPSEPRRAGTFARLLGVGSLAPSGTHPAPGGAFGLPAERLRARARTGATTGPSA